MTTSPASPRPVWRLFGAPGQRGADAGQRTAVEETHRAMRLLGLAVLAMTATITIGPMARALLREHPATIGGILLLCGGQLGALVGLLRRRVPAWLPWALLALSGTGLCWMLLTRGDADATRWAPGYWGVPLLALAMSSLPRRRYFGYAMAAIGLFVGLVALLGWQPGWLFALDQAWVLQPLLATLLFGDALLQVARSRDRSDAEALDVRLARQRAALDDHRYRETTRLLHDDVLHALHGLARATDQTHTTVVADCRTACRAVRERHRSQAAQLAQLESAAEQASPSALGPWHITPNEETRRALVNTVWPGLGAALATALLAGPQMESPRLLVPLALGLVLVGAASALHLRARPLNRGIALLMLVAALAGWQVNLAVAPTSPGTVYVLWLAWIVSPAIHLVALASRLWVAASVAGGWLTLQLVGLFWHFRDPAVVAAMSSTVTTGAGECIITVLVLAVVRRQAVREAASLEVAAQLTSTIRALQDSYRQDLRWSEQVTREALPLLQEVGDEVLSTQHPAVRRRAAQLEDEVRDLLLLGPRHVDLARALAASRSAGWNVTSSLDDEDPATALAAMTRLLEVIGPASRPGQPLTLSATVSGATAVVPEAVTTAQQDQWTSIVEQGLRVDVHEDFARLLMTPRAC